VLGVLLAFGAGLVSVVSQKELNLPPYLMQSKAIPKNSTALVVGMGLGDIDVKELILDFDGPLVIDADIFYKPFIKEILEKKGDIVLTPHPKEFASLLKICDIADVSTKEIQLDRFKWALEFSKKYPKATLVLKGANSIIANDGYLYINTFGTPVYQRVEVEMC